MSNTKRAGIAATIALTTAMAGCAAIKEGACTNPDSGACAAATAADNAVTAVNDGLNKVGRRVGSGLSEATKPSNDPVLEWETALKETGCFTEEPDSKMTGATRAAQDKVNELAGKKVGDYAQAVRATGIQNCALKP